MFNSEKI